MFLDYLKSYLHSCEVYKHLYLFRNLKKSEESVLRTEKEIKNNEKEIKDLTEELTKLEDKAAEIINDCRQAEVSVMLI